VRKRRLRQLGWIVGDRDGVGINHTKKRARGLSCRANPVADGPSQFARSRRAGLNPGENPGAIHARLGVAAAALGFQRLGSSDGSIVTGKGPSRWRIGLLPTYLVQGGIEQGRTPPTRVVDRGWRGRLGAGSGSGKTVASGWGSARQSERSRALLTSFTAAFHDGSSPRPSLRALQAPAHCWLSRDGSRNGSASLGPVLASSYSSLAQLQQLGHGCGSRNQGPATGVRSWYGLWISWARPLFVVHSGGSGSHRSPLLPSAATLSIAVPAATLTRTRSRRPFARLLTSGSPGTRASAAA